MKQPVTPGGHIDAATSAEVAELARVLLRTETFERVRASETVTLDAAGAGSVNVYKVPLGMEFRLARVVVEADGFGYEAMFTNAAGAVRIKRADRLIDGYNLAAGIPNVWTGGSGSAPRYKQGETVTLEFFGGPADTGVLVSLEGDQFPKGGET